MATGHAAVHAAPVRWLLPVVVVLGVLVGVAVQQVTARASTAADRDAFEREVERSTDAFQTQLDRIELALNAVHGLHADQRVTTASYRAFVAQLAGGGTLTARFAGVEAVGFAHERAGAVAFHMVEPAGTSLSVADVRRHPELTAGLWASVGRDGTTLVPLRSGLPGPSALVSPLTLPVDDDLGGDDQGDPARTGQGDLHGWSLVFIDEVEILRHATRGSDLVATIDPPTGAEASARAELADHGFELSFAPAEGLTSPWLRWQFAVMGLGATVIVWLLGWVVHVQVTARRSAEVEVAHATADLRAQEQRFRTLAAASPIGIYLTDEAGNVTYVNQRLAEILDVHRRQLLGEGLWERLRPRDQVASALLERLSRDPDSELRCVPATGPSDRVVSLRASAIVDRDGLTTGFTGTAEDITGQVAAHEQLAEREAANRALADRFAHQARHDALTGIPNRVQLLERLSNLDRDAAGVALVLLDLDGFKLVNDTLGHAAGDGLLVAISQRVSACVRDGDLLARLGGDEFAVLLTEGRQPQTALHLADRLLTTIQRPVELGAETVTVGASVGVAVLTPEVDSPEELLQQADLAMYAAKEAGRGRVEVFAPELGTATHHRHVLERELRSALERNELSVTFQPIVELERGRIAGVETLARWEHPMLGNVSPSAFIPAAERAGLVPLLGSRVRQRALQAATRWWGQHRLPVGLNASARELAEPGYAVQVLHELRTLGLPTAAIVIEVTESQLATNSVAVEELRVLRSRGVRVAIDDFGAGYSSLARLRALPVDVLKIDRSFITGLEEPAGRSLVAAIVHLGRTLGCEVIAEGVETDAQVTHLAGVGCTLAQGYRFHHPMPAAAVDALLASAAAGRPHLVAVAR